MKDDGAIDCPVVRGHEVVDVAFTEADGHLNRFEPMEKWSHVFKDKHWQVNDVVRSLAKPFPQWEQEKFATTRLLTTLPLPSGDAGAGPAEV